MKVKMPHSSVVLLVLILLGSCGQELALKEATQSSPTQNSERSSESGRENRETGTCPSVYEPVCAQPPMPECSSGSYCAQVMPNPKTYSNECERVQVQATFISKGSCPDSNF